MDPHHAAPPLSPAQGRLFILLAAVLWSTSGAFTKALTRDTPLGLNSPPIAPLQIACGRVLFAGLVLLPTLRRRDFAFRPAMLVMLAFFAIMNATFVSALALGTAANAIVLQYTAPLWMYLASVWWLGEQADLRSLATLGIGLIGVAIIVIGGWQGGELAIVLVALVSGVGYAGVMVCLRVLRDVAPRWLTVWNQLGSGLLLIPFICGLAPPEPAQLGVLIIYGVVQMAAPYWLVARGLRSVSPQEAGTLTLLEALLTPFWAYTVSGETPHDFTLWGGSIILGALVWRYWPRGRATA